MIKPGPAGALGLSRLQKKLGDRFLDLLILHGLNPEDLPEELAGSEVHIPQVNFDVPLELKVRAQMGPPPYAVRAKFLEDSIANLRAELSEQWRRLADTCQGEPAKFATIWQSLVEAIDLAPLNDLVKEHNTYYPIEANLQADPETGKIMIGATVWRPQPKLTASSLLEQFPPDLDRALAGPAAD